MRMSAKAKFISLVLTLLILVNTLFYDRLLRASTPELPDPFADILTAGEQYLDGITAATGNGLELVQLLETIDQTPFDELDEEIVREARGMALKSAEKTAQAAGAIAVIVEGAETLGQDFPAAVDALTETRVFYSDMPTGTIESLHTLGLTDDQIAAYSSGVIDKAELRADVQANGLPVGVVTSLVEAGFSQEEIAQIEAAFLERGVFRLDLDTRLAQFQASQDELSAARTQANILYIRLLRQQIAVRQAHGLAPRAPTDAELNQLAQDEIRLLTHIGHLDDLMGGGADADIGEGEWWAIERYSTRAIERLDTLIVDTQNLGTVIVDLFVLTEIRAAAIAAQAGDPIQAKAEVDVLGDLLAYLVGDDQLAAGQQARHAQVPWWRGLPVLGSLLSVPVAHAAEKMALERTRDRLENASPECALQQQGVGHVAECYEENNTKAIFFSIGIYDRLDESLLDAIKTWYYSTLPQGDTTTEIVVEWLWQVLSGYTGEGEEAENPLVLALNLGISLVPVIGVFPDICDLIYSDSVFVKVMAVFGILSEFGLLVPLLMAPSLLIDTSFDFFKTLIKSSDTMRRLGSVADFNRAADIMLDLLDAGGKRAIRLTGGALPTDPDNIYRLIARIYEEERLWAGFEEFGEWCLRTGTDLGDFTDGAVLLGRALDLGAASDETGTTLLRLGDAVLFDDVLGISDNAVEGLSKLVKNVDEDTALVLTGLLRGTGLDTFEQVMGNVKLWDEAAEDGFARLAPTLDDLGLAHLLTECADEPEALRKALPILGSDPNTTARFLDNTDEMVGLASHYGYDGFEALARYEDQAIELYRHFNSHDLGPFLRNVIADSTVDLEKTSIVLSQGFQVRTMLDDLSEPVDLHIPGRWADTPAEASLRKAAAAQKDELLVEFLRDEGFLPEDVMAVVQDVRTNPGKYELTPDEVESEIVKIKEFAAQREVAAQHDNLEWYQVKVSTHGPEVDVFIDIDTWNQLEASQNIIETRLKEIFGVSEVDFYQVIEPELWKIFLCDVDPGKHVPAGSVSFLSDGTIAHDLLKR